MTRYSYMEWLRLAVRIETDSCIHWPYYRDGDGYGKVKHRGQMRFASTVACELTHGTAPSGCIATHSCRSRDCINPRHLAWATRQQNSADMVRDDTRPYGTRHGRAKLTENQVRTIRRECAGGAPHQAIADEYGVSRATVSMIATYRTWKHVE